MIRGGDLGLTIEQRARTIVSEDKDFARRLAFRAGLRPPGLVRIALPGYLPAEKAVRVVDALRGKDATGVILVIESNSGAAPPPAVTTIGPQPTSLACRPRDCLAAGCPACLRAQSHPGDTSHARSRRFAMAAHRGARRRLGRCREPARAHPQRHEGPPLRRQALSRQPQQQGGDGPEGLPLRGRSARARRPRRPHHPGAAHRRGAGALRQGRRARRHHPEQRLCRGRRRGGRGHAGRDPRHRQAP